MIIKIEETNGYGFEESILKDIGTFKNLQSWLLAIKNEEVAFYPLDCAVRIDSKWLYVVHAGQLSKNIDDIINKVKKLPKEYSNFPNDYTAIKADLFERELFFNTNPFIK